jgi:hypothetical protein
MSKSMQNFGKWGTILIAAFGFVPLCKAPQFRPQYSGCTAGPCSSRDRFMHSQRLCS